MIRLLLNRYTEREKLLLLEALSEAQYHLAKRRVEFNDAPRLLADLQKAILVTSSEHVHDVVARTLGIDTRKAGNDRHTADIDADLEKLSPAEIEEFWT